MGLKKRNDSLKHSSGKKGIGKITAINLYETVFK
jgi:hypothetical protein